MWEQIYPSSQITYLIGVDIMVEVTRPKPSEQYRKTPMVKVNKVVGVDPDTGDPISIPQYQVIGGGDAERIKTYGDVSDGAKQSRVKLKDEGKLTEEQDVSAGEALDSHLASKSEWGVGCPSGCGRFWAFKSTPDGLSMVPSDPAAYTGDNQMWLPDSEEDYTLTEDDDEDYPEVEENPLVGSGYLQWQPQEDGSVKFICDKCGAEVHLV